MRYLPIIITLVFLTNISFIGAQKTATIRGAITEMGNGNPLIGATIYIIELQKGEVTDFNGDYTLNQIKSGTYTLITSYIGYNTDTSTLVINNNLEVIHNVNLTVEGLTLETVTVTAQAEGQMAAINRQISNDNIVNVVSAKRIQEVPDANAAETLGRLSGVSLVRSGGEGSKVSIRGMAPSFNKVQVEGMRMASTGEGDRSTDLSMISPYMLEGIELTKAAMAENEADAIGGSVNFILREAPEKPTFDLLMQSGYASYKQRFNNQKLVVGGSKRLFSNKLGIFAQVDLDQRDRSANEINVNYINRTNLLDNFPISTGSMSLRDIDRTVKKGGATIVLDYKLKGGSIKFSNFGSIIKKKENIQYELFNPFFNTHSYGYNQRNPNLNIYNSALKMDKKVGVLLIEGGVALTHSENNSPDDKDFYATESNAFEQKGTLANNPDTLLYYARNNLAKAVVQQVSKSLSYTKEQEISTFLNMTLPVTISKGINLKLKFGGKYKELTKDYNIDYNKIPVAQSGHGSTFVKKSVDELSFLGSLEADATTLPYELFVTDNRPERFSNGKFGLQRSPSNNNINAFWSLADNYYFYDYVPSTKDDYKGKEKYTAFYIQPTFNFGEKLTIIPGLRYEQVETSYLGNRGNNTLQNWDAGYIHRDTTVFNKNSFILPMLHLRYKMNSWSDVRLAYTHTLSRPDFSLIIPKWDIGLNSVSWNNPFLLPSLSKNIDSYFSIYTNKIGLLTFGGFYKNIENLIYNSGNTVITQEDVTTHGFPANLIGVTINKTVNNTSPANLYGFEIEWQTRFWYLNNFLNKFILTINYTQTFSDVSYDRTVLKQEFLQVPPYVTLVEEVSPYNERLLFQPKNIFNFTLGFEDKGWSSRLSFLFQNNIFSTPNFFETLRGATDKYYRLDFNLRKNLPWDGFELLANVNNINAAAEKDKLISNNALIKQQFYGVTYDLGIRYRIK